MPKFIITWDAGFGECYDCIEANTIAEAKRQAHDSWQEDAESNAQYDARPLTEETAYQYGYEDELDEGSN